LKKYAFTVHHHTSRQVLVQRKPDNWRKMMRHQIERDLIRNAIDLEGKTVYVRGGSAYLSRMRNLSDEIGGDINIIEASPEFTTEDLIQLVADGEIDYTIADDNIAELNKAYYSNIDVSTYVSFPQRIAWAVRKNSPQLLEALNTWISKMKEKTEYYAIYDKYYKNRNSYRRRIQSEYFSRTGGGISKYDEMIKKYATNLKWDWRILASLIYQESRFKTDVKSWAGAAGLMQLMPSTAQMYGVTDLNNPLESLRAGVSYLNYLDRFWSDMIPDSTERIKFVLASYNIGPGHIIDARNLAQKYGANPDVWDENVEVYLLNKSKEKFYHDEVVKLGYARGRETVKYVREVLDRYEQYKQFIG
jgi:membrane-bound lytic murein transglycosylase F